MADTLNNTGAIVRKGVHSFELKLRGDATIGMSGHWTSPLENPWNAERAGQARGGSMGVSPQYGGGTVIAARCPPQNGGSSPAPDKNRTVPGNGGSLAAAVACVNKGC